MSRTRSTVRPLRFLAVFGLVFLVLLILLRTPPVRVADAHFTRSLVTVSSAVLHVCGSSAVQRDDILSTANGSFAVQMKDGCNASNVTLLLWAAMLAFPAGWRARLAGLAVGTLAIHSVNIVRFISLFYIGQFSASLFEFAHVYLWEFLLMVDVLIVFRLWVMWLSRANAATEAHAG